MQRELPSWSTIAKAFEPLTHDLTRAIGPTDVIFLDRDMFAREGFTSGLLIEFREKLRRFREMGLRVRVLTLRTCTAGIPCGHGPCIRTRTEAGISITDCIFSYDIRHVSFSGTEEVLAHLLRRASPQIILTYTAAIFLTELDILAVRQANKTGAVVVSILADELFPRHGEHPRMLINAYYAELCCTEITAVSERIRREFEAHTGCTAQTYKSLWHLPDITLPLGTPRGRFITLVNVHPLKGIVLFERIAARNPQRSFLVVKTWPDVRPYSPPHPNIMFRDFFKNPKELYRLTRILLVPSLYNEGAARVAIEAMYNRIPVIVNGVGSLSEIVSNPEYVVEPPHVNSYRMIDESILTPEVDAIDLDRCADDFSHIINLIEAGREQAEKLCNQAEIFARRYVASGEEIFTKQASSWLALAERRRKSMPLGHTASK